MDPRRFDAPPTRKCVSEKVDPPFWHWIPLGSPTDPTWIPPGSQLQIGAKNTSTADTAQQTLTAEAAHQNKQGQQKSEPQFRSCL